MKLLLMTRYQVGLKVLDWLLRQYPQDVMAVVTTAEDEVFRATRSAGLPAFVFSNEDELTEALTKAGLKPDIGLMFWWPFFIKKTLIDFPVKGFINAHTSLLPHDACSMPNFWTLVDQSPYGVTLHMVDSGIDSGPVIVQKRLEKTWEDTDETLYHRSLAAAGELFFETWPLIRGLDFPIFEQDAAERTMHTLAQTLAATQLRLEDSMPVRRLLNLLRARSYEGAPGCWFEDGGERFEVRINIKKLKD